MKDELRKQLDDYRIISINIINSLVNENIDVLNDLFSKRQDVINSINELDYSSDEFRTVYDEIELAKIEEELCRLLTEKREFVKTEMDKLSGYKSARKSYMKKFSPDSIYFNKKI